jgi:hypothetical protein
LGVRPHTSRSDQRGQKTGVELIRFEDKDPKKAVAERKRKVSDGAKALAAYQSERAKKQQQKAAINKPRGRR